MWSPEGIKADASSFRLPVTETRRTAEGCHEGGAVTDCFVCIGISCCDSLSIAYLWSQQSYSLHFFLGVLCPPSSSPFKSSKMYAEMCPLGTELNQVQKGFPRLFPVIDMIHRAFPESQHSGKFSQCSRS